MITYGNRSRMPGQNVEKIIVGALKLAASQYQRDAREHPTLAKGFGAQERAALDMLNAIEEKGLSYALIKDYKGA